MRAQKPWVLGAGKGGVGTTTLTALLGTEAGLGGTRTLLIDGNLGQPGLHRIFGMLDGQPGFGSLQDRSVDPGDLLVAAAPNVWVLPGGGWPTGTMQMSTGERAGGYRRVSRLFTDFDLVLIDGGATLDSILPAIQLDIAGLWTVTVGERVSMAGAYALIKVVGASYPEVPVFPLFNRSAAHEAEFLALSMNGAALRFLRRRLGTPAHVPAMQALMAVGRVPDIRLSEPGSLAVGALVSRLIQPSGA